jgi:hypothetical protein
MSLINDALRRAKEAQQNAPPPAGPGPSFRPVESAEHHHPRVAGTLPAVFAIFALIALFLAWHFSHAGVRARDNGASAQPASSAAAPAQVQAPDVAKAPPALTNEAPASPIAVTKPAEPAATNATVGPEAVAPKPAPLRLQAILYHPRHPSAVVSGKTLFVGDKIGELRLIALDKESVTLVGGGHTNVLSLDQ